MKKFSNYRPMMFAAIALVLGIFIASMFVFGKVGLIAFITFLLVILFSLIISIVFMIKHKRDFGVFRFFKRLMIFMIVVILGVSVCLIKDACINHVQPEYSTYTITARICEKPYNKDYIQTFVVKDVVIENVDTGKSNKLIGKATFTAYNDFINYELEHGAVVEFKAYLWGIDINEYSTNNINDNILVEGRVISTISKLDEKKFDVFEYIKLNAKEILFNNLDSEYAGIGYGMIFGDTSYMKNETVEIFNAAGVSHLLAVSGLHVGFVVFLLDLILGVCKVKNKTRFFVVSSVLFLYMIFCNFTVSVVRAFIMTFCMLYCKARDKTYDSLSSLSLAAIVILLISPFELFSTGFRLSFMAVLGIILLYPILNKFFSYFLFEQFASSLAMSLAASIGIMPVMAISFGSFSLLSIFTNMIVIPIASVAFMILFVTLIFSMIIPALGILIIPFQYIMSFVNAVAKVASTISINSLPANGQLGLITLFLGGMFVASPFVITKTRVKLISLAILIIICTAILVPWSSLV